MIPRDPTHLEAAHGIGARLCRDAIWHGRRCNWIGAAGEEIGGRLVNVHRTLKPDIYGGTCGVALFLARLYELTGDRIVLETAAGAVEQALSRLADVQDDVRIGVYSGFTGIGWVATILGRLTDRDDWIERGLELVETHAADDIEGRRGLDVVTGIAGVIPVLIDLHRGHGRDSLLDRARELGDKLLATSRRSDAGTSWNTIGAPDGYGQPDLTGFSHGAAGIAWALLELHQATRHQPFLDAARDAIRYEQSHFRADQDNWSDFRDSPDFRGREQEHTKCTIAWCHGSPGIGLSRLRAYELTGDTAYRAQAEAAMRSTAASFQRAQTGQGNMSLCHGHAGNAELFVLAHQVLGKELPANQASPADVATSSARIAIDRYLTPRMPVPSGVPSAEESPSLLLGTAGLGYFLLRLFDPAAVPPVLIMIPRDG